MPDPPRASGAPPAVPPGQSRSKLRSWLELLRVPNLLTVPGDPLAGFVVAKAAGDVGADLTAPEAVSLALAATVSLLLYAAGLLWNDWFDLAEDRRERPQRPLPSGRVRPASAAVAAGALMAAALVFAYFAGRSVLVVAGILAAAILAYNALLKRNGVLGPATMGLCRGLSVLVGAAALPGGPLLVTAALVLAGGAVLYIAAVTALAAGETRATDVKGKAAFIAVAASAWLLGLVLAVQEGSPESRWARTAAAAFTMIYVGFCLAKLGGKRHEPGKAGEDGKGAPPAEPPEPALVQKTIGRLLRGAILFQVTAVVSTSWSGAALAGGLLVCFGLNAVLVKRFYAS